MSTRITHKAGGGHLVAQSCYLLVFCNKHLLVLMLELAGLCSGNAHYLKNIIRKLNKIKRILHVY